MVTPWTQFAGDNFSQNLLTAIAFVPGSQETIFREINSSLPVNAGWNTCCNQKNLHLFSLQYDCVFLLRCPSVTPFYIPRIRRMLWFYVEAARHPLPAAHNGVNAITQKPRDGLFSNLVYTLVVIVSWPDKLFKVVGQRSRSQRQKMMWFFRHFWIFISYHIFLLNQVEGAIAIPPSNSAPLPLFCPSVRPSVCPSIGLLTTFSGFCTFADKSLGRNGIELEMQMFPDDLPLLKGDLYVIFRHQLLTSFLSACPTIWFFFFFFFHFFFLRLGLGQRRAVVIIGRWLLPSLVDTGDICCHYWQHILVSQYQ